MIFMGAPVSRFPSSAFRFPIVQNRPICMGKGTKKTKCGPGEDPTRDTSASMAMGDARDCVAGASSHGQLVTTLHSSYRFPEC